jgi:hypothetical protein
MELINKKRGGDLKILEVKNKFHEIFMFFSLEFLMKPSKSSKEEKRLLISFRDGQE